MNLNPDYEPASWEWAAFSFHRHSWFRRATPCGCPTGGRPSRLQTCPTRSGPNSGGHIEPTMSTTEITMEQSTMYVFRTEWGSEIQPFKIRTF